MRFFRAHLRFDKLQHTAVEARLIELERMIANGLCVIARLVESRQRFRETCHRLFVEESPRYAVYHRGLRAARAISDDRATGSLRFHRRNAEIFFPRQDERAAVCVIVQYLFVGKPTQEADSWPGQLPEALLVAPAADDYQRQS